MSLSRAYTSLFEFVLKQWSRFRFRYDIFISYRRSEASEYATKLCEQLTQLGFACFLDKEELPPGHPLSVSLTKAILKSKTFVLVGSPRALESEYVQLEIREFAKSDRLLIPIDVSESISHWAANPIQARDLVRICEASEQFATGVPSLKVAEDIDRSFRGMRRRTRRLLEAVALAFLFLATVFVAAYFLRIEVAERVRLAGELEAKRQEAEKTLVELNKANERANKEAADARNRLRVLRAQASWENHDPDGAIALALEAAQSEQAPAEAERVLAEFAYAPGTRRVLTGHGADVLSVAFSRDGRRALSGASDGGVLLWEVSTGQPMRRFEGHFRGVKSLAFNSDGTRALSGSSDGTVIFWDTSSGRKLQVWKISGEKGPLATPTQFEIRGLVFSPDGGTAFAASANNAVCRFDTRTGQSLPCFRWNTLNGINCIAISPEGDTAVVGAGGRSEGPELILWRLADGQVVRRWPTKSGTVLAVAFGLGADTVTAVHPIGITRWNKVLQQKRFETPSTRSAAIGPGGRTALIAPDDGSLVQLDVITGERRVLRGHGSEVKSVTYDSEGRLALSGSLDDTLRLWDVEYGEVMHRLEGRAPISVSPGGNIVASASVVKANAVALWDFQSGRAIGNVLTRPESQAPQRRTAFVSSLSFGPDGQKLLSGWSTNDVSGDGTDSITLHSITLWNIQTSFPVQRLAGHSNNVRDVIFFPSGFDAVSVSSDRTLRLWNLKTGLQTRKSELQAFSGIALSHDGSIYAEGAQDGTVTISAVATGKVLYRFKDYDQEISSLVLSPDSLHVLTGYKDGRIILWNLKAGVRSLLWKEHIDRVTSLAFSLNGRRALSASNDGRVLFLDLETGGILRAFLAHGKSVTAVAFGPDESSALSASDSEVIKWRIQTKSELIAWVRANRHIRKLDSGN